MSISKEWVSNKENWGRVLALYRSSELPTMEEIARTLDTTQHNVAWSIRNFMPEAEREALAAVRYSRSKTGHKNPMKGRFKEAHPRWKGECPDGGGYLTCLYNGTRQFVHRVVLAKALGLEKLPEELVVHHIDGDPLNNDLDNLALMTPAGHKTIHFLQVKDSLALASKRSTIEAAVRSMISQ